MATGTQHSTGTALCEGFRPVRMITRPDSPWPGMLTRLPDGEAALVVDAALLGDDWCGWDADPSGHVLCPQDVLRRKDGHDVILPMCTERAVAFVDRREAADAPLEQGEIVTLAVSLIRGITEYRRTDPHGECVGQWWLTVDGRPVLVTDAAGQGCVEAAELLTRLSSAARGSLRSGIEAAAAAILVARELERSVCDLEARLFEAADALPLTTNSLAPVLVRRLPDQSDSRTRTAAPDESGVRRFGGLLDADLADLFSLTASRVWRRLRRRHTTGRRRQLLVAAAVAAVVLGGGMLWPTGSEGPANAGESSRSPAAALTPFPGAAGSAGQKSPPAAAAAPSAATQPVPDSAAEWERVATTLLTRRTACHTDSACLGEVFEDPSVQLPAGVIDRPAEQRRAVLLDSFGDAAVLRVDAVDGADPSQLVMLVRVDDLVLLRDVSSIAEQNG